VLRYVPLSLILAACIPPSRALTAPPRDASWDARSAAYQRLRPTSTHQNDILDGDTGVAIDARDHGLRLADGTHITQGAELIPLVDAGSPTATAVRRERRHETWRQRLLVAGVASLATGAAVTLASLFGAEDEPGPIFYSGAGLAAAGGVAAIVSLQFRRRAVDARLTAYRTFDASLRARLGICVRGTRLVDCDGAPFVITPRPSAGRTIELTPLPPE
jgi:hypothetical protein